MFFTVRIDVPLSLKRCIVCSQSLLSFTYVQNQTTRRVNGRMTRCFVKHFAKSLLILSAGAKASVKITRPFHNSLRPSHPTLRPGPLLPTSYVCLPAVRVHVFLSAVSALCCTNRGRLPKVHATRPRLIIILRRIVDPARPGRAQENKASIRNSAGCAAGKTIGAYYVTCDHK